MKKKTFWVLCSVLIMTILSSCSRRIVDFTIISSKNVPITENGNNFQKATSRVKGVDSKWSVLFIPGVPDMKEAIDKAIEKYPGAVALTDGVVYNKSWSCFLFGKNQYVVEGTPLYPESQDYVRPAVNRPARDLNYNQPPLPDSENGVKMMHVVKRGESLSTIAPLYKVTIPELVKWNKLSSSELYEGMKLLIYIR